MRILFVTIFSIFSFFLLSNDASANSENLQKLINETEEEGVLQLPPGVYEGNVKIQKPITIKGSKEVVLKSSNKDEAVISIENTSNVSIDHLKIQTKGSAIKISDAKQIHLSFMQLENVFSGIGIYRAKDITIEGLEIVGNHQHYSKKGNGISVYNSENMRFKQNYMNRVQDGIYIEGVNNITSIGNKVENSRYGTHFMYSKHAKAQDNIFIKNVTGFMVMMTTDIDLSQNKISYQEGFNGTGVTLYDVKNINVHDNLVSGNRVALTIQKTSLVNAFDNIFQMNQTAVESIGSEASNLITKNYFVGNLVNVRSDETGIKLVSNYYDDYAGIDINNDGIGEDTYVALQSFGQWMVRKPVYQYYVESPSVVLLNEIDKQTNKSTHQLLTDKLPIVNFELAKNIQFNINSLQLISGMIILIVCIVFWRRSVRT